MSFFVFTLLLLLLLLLFVLFCFVLFVFVLILTFLGRPLGKPHLLKTVALKEIQFYLCFAEVVALDGARHSLKVLRCSELASVTSEARTSPYPGNPISVKSLDRRLHHLIFSEQNWSDAEQHAGSWTLVEAPLTKRHL